MLIIFLIMLFIMTNCVSHMPYVSDMPKADHITNFNNTMTIHRYNNVNVEVWERNGKVVGYVTGLKGDRIVVLPEVDTAKLLKQIK